MKTPQKDSVKSSIYQASKNPSTQMWEVFEKGECIGHCTSVRDKEILLATLRKKENDKKGSNKPKAKSEVSEEKSQES